MPFFFDYTNCNFFHHINTVKVLVRIIPSGAIVFISPTQMRGKYQIRSWWNRVDYWINIEVGDQIMADKGFDIQDLLE